MSAAIGVFAPVVVITVTGKASPGVGQTDASLDMADNFDDSAI